MNEDKVTIHRPLLNLTEPSESNINDSPSKTNSLSSLNSKENGPRFLNYDEKEEATCIKQLKFLQFRPLMFYVVVPLMSLFTGFVLAICLYWLTDLRKRLLYTQVGTVEEASHILVHGLEGNVDIVPL